MSIVLLPSFGKDEAVVVGGDRLAGESPPAPDLPLSPLEHDILTLCLHSTEDPRDVGLLPALLSAEQRAPVPSPQ